jgi:hypothetical protein
MQQQERELIAGLFDRLQPFESQPRDPEAEALIKERVTRQAGSSYLLVQTVLVQEQALKAAQERIAELEAKAAQASPAASFLGSAPKIGPWGSAQAQSAPASVPPTAASTRSPLQAALSPQPMGMMGGGGGGGFLRSALATAAGVAGGALLFEGIRNLMGSSPGAFGPALAQTPSSLLPPDTVPPLDTSPSESSSDTFAQASSNDDNLQPQDDQPADYDTASMDDDQDFGGSDFGGGSDDENWT